MRTAIAEMMGDVVEQNSGGEPPIRYDNGHPVSSTCQAAETQKQQLTISTQEIPVQKDGKRSWCVCAAAYCIQVVILGVLHAFGVFFVAFIDEFKTTKSTTGKYTNRRSHIITSDGLNQVSRTHPY